jgi:hypothetical protein
LLQVSLAKYVSGVPLTAITSGQIGATTLPMADFIAGDLNGRSTDEIVVFSASQVAILSAD